MIKIEDPTAIADRMGLVTVRATCIEEPQWRQSSSDQPTVAMTCAVARPLAEHEIVAFVAMFGAMLRTCVEKRARETEIGTGG